MVVVAAETHKLLLVPGKRTSGAPALGGPALGVLSRPISSALPALSSSQASSDSDCSSSGPPLRKRQRLTHLSPEEKALRRKLKNRVAAQTARDRKKAKMGELEQQVLELELENHKLHMENVVLRQRSSGLLTENQELRERLGLHTLDSKDSVQVLVSAGGEAGLVGIGSSESAELRLRVPLQQVQAQIPLNLKTSQWIHMVLMLQTMRRFRISDLLLGILDILDPELFLKSCEQECAEPTVQLGDGGHPLPAPPPPAVGDAPVKLEALNELIHFDHIYTKPLEEEEEEEEGQEGDDMESDMEVKVEAQAHLDATDADDEVEVEMVYVKAEPEEVVIPPGRLGDHFLS
ncbi:hypothetical protein CRUP_017273, partial [Coryphaenoides rupestris]